MKKETKKWWLLATENEKVIEVSDDYYNHGRLFETSKPFWGTREELVRHIQEHWFTPREIKLLKKGWQAYQKIALVVRGSNKELHWRWRGTFKQQPTPNGVAWNYTLKGYDSNARGITEHLNKEELKSAPWFKHDVLVDADNAKICLSFEEKHGRNLKNAPWTKTLHITCLDQDGKLNQVLAKTIITVIGKFVADLQSTIR